MLCVRVQPGARRTGVLGRVPDVAGERLRVAVSAPPEDGRANRAVCDVVASALGVAARDVSVAQGAGARQKTLRVVGDPTALAVRLEAL